MPMTCERCGDSARRVRQIPTGPHRGELWCLVCAEAEERAGRNLDHHAVHGDEIPGGMIVENYGPRPICFYTKSSMEEYRKAHGLILKESFCPFPGTDIDPQGVQNPEGYVDEYTRQARASLLLRALGCQSSDEVKGVYVNETVYASDDAKEVRRFGSS